MSRRVVGCRCLFLVAALGWHAGGVSRARADEDPRTIVAFLQQLKAHGLHDIALEYIAHLRADTSLPADLKIGLDYEEGRTLVDEASHTNDLVLREDLLREARDKLEAFVKAHTQRPEARDALRKTSQAAGRARLSGAAPGRGVPGQAAKKDAARRGPGPPTCRPFYEAKLGVVVRWQRPRRSIPSRCPTRTPGRWNATPSSPPTSTGCSSKGSATTSWHSPIPAGSADRTKYLDAASSSSRASPRSPGADGRPRRSDVAG